MPYNFVKSGKKVKLVKKSTGKTVATTDSMKKAKKVAGIREYYAHKT